MNKLLRFLALSCFAVVVWIIYAANTAIGMDFVIHVNALPFRDKAGHLLIFGVMTFLFNFGFNFKRIQVLRTPVLLGTFLLSIFVVVEEFSQLFIVHRSFEWMDLLADGLGMLTFHGLSVLVEKKSKQRENMCL